MAGTLILAMAIPAHADWLVTGGRIVKIHSTRAASDASFVVLTEGGTGPCAAYWIYFYPTGACSPEIQKRSYAAALMALSTGMRVDIAATDTNCEGAFVISVYP
jgi:Family of unknown function (DUF5992)